MRRRSPATLFIFATLVASAAWGADPEIGKAARYCNPLPMVTAPGGNASGDVTVIREQGKYYMYCTGGGAWISDDMLDWSFHRVANVPVAPHVVKYNGSFYRCGNSGPLFKADSGSIPVTINKILAMNALSRSSSEQPGRDAAYAVDNSSGAWWEPAATDAQPTLTIELSPATRFDKVQLFTIDSVRLMFNSGRGSGSGGRRGNAPTADNATATTATPERPVTNAYQYKIEVSMDGQTYATTLDQTTNTILRNTIFEEIPAGDKQRWLFKTP